MTDKEKIRAEIIRRIEELQPFHTSENLRAHGALTAYYQILSFIGSMQEEPTIPDIVDEHYWEMLGEEPVSEDMEEAAKNYMMSQNPPIWGLYHGFKAGAQWKKQQMMKSAIDGVITFDYYGDNDKTYGCIAHDSFSLEELGLKDGDKVKLIIIKED